MPATFLKRKLPDQFTLLSYALFLNRHYWVIAIVIVVIIGGALAFPLSYFSNFNVLLGMMLLPFSIWIVGRQRMNYWLLALLVTLGASVLYSPVNIFYFFSIAFFIVMVIEMYVGRMNAIVLFLIFFMSPFFEQVAGVLGFPVRLFLTEVAGKILLLTGLNIEVEGNMMALNGNSFSVDDACMGMNMLSTSLLIGVLMMIHQYKRSRRTLSFVALAGFFMTVVALNVISNLLRIIALVCFNIGPAQMMHEGIGVICFVVYSIIPGYYVAQWLVRRFGHDLAGVERSYRPTHVVIKCALILVAVGMLWIGMELPGRKMIAEQFRGNVNTLAGFNREILDKGVVKLSNDEALVYLKPIPEFFSGEHTPLFCWKGSGYEFKHIRERKMGTHVIYTGELIRADGMLWTAWWYTNGEVQTIDQFNWRGRMLRGEKGFSLINVTAADEVTMLRYAQQILQKSFDPVTTTD